MPQTPLAPQPPEDRRGYIQSARKRLAQGIFFALVTLLTLLSLCVAWFLNNSGVATEAALLQSGSAGGFELASVGQAGAYEALLAGSGWSAGESFSLGALSGQSTSSSAAQITWMMSADNAMNNLKRGELEPGSRGTLAFYVIPDASGTLAVDFSLETLLYQSTSGGALAELSDATLTALISRHLLFFLLTPTEDGNYTARWLSDGTFRLTFEDAQAGQPQLVTLYWVWPYLFGQLLVHDPAAVLSQRSLLPDTVQNTAELQAQLQAELAAYAAAHEGDAELPLSPAYFCSYQSGRQPAQCSLSAVSAAQFAQTLEQIAGGSISSSEYLLLNQYYNEADEYIGDRLQYLALRLNAAMG